MEGIMENWNKLKEILAQVLQIDPSEITEESSPDTIPNWDSFNGLMLVTELEKTFHVKFTMDEIIAVKTVKDIREALQQHGVDKI